MNIVTIYQYGIVCLAGYALFWAFILDRNKPATVREFALKLLCRYLFLVFVYSVLIGFAHFALGLFPAPE